MGFLSAGRYLHIARWVGTAWCVWRSLGVLIGTTERGVNWLGNSTVGSGDGVDGIAGFGAGR